MLQSQIACHSVYVCPNQGRCETRWWKHGKFPRNWDYFDVALLTIQLYIQLDQFIIVQVTLPTLSLWFQILWGDLIIMPFIMVVLQFTLQIFHFNLILNQFYIHTPLLLDQLMIMKWIIYWNSSIQNTMNIFWMLTYRCNLWLQHLLLRIYETTQ